MKEIKASSNTSCVQVIKCITDDGKNEENQREQGNSLEKNGTKCWVVEKIRCVEVGCFSFCLA